MASIFKRKGRNKYTIAYKDENGAWQEAQGYRDKEATKTKARELERRAERIRAGMPVVKEEKLDRPLQESIDAYLAELELQGRSASHKSEMKRILETLKEKCQWTTLRKVTADGLRAFLATLKGKSARTVNSYRRTALTFMEWCRRNDYVEGNPLTKIPTAKEGGKKHRPRRAYSLEEFKRLLAKAGRKRRIVYLAAGLSGLRKNELRQLEKRDLDPSGERPVWKLRAEAVKGRRSEVIPMVPELAKELLPLWQALEKPTERLFKAIPLTQTLGKDLKAAGIPKVDPEGRRADFHSLRYFFCSQMAKLLPIQKVRVLMRHRDIRMTCNLYMDLGLTDVGEEVWSAPSILKSEKGG